MYIAPPPPVPESNVAQYEDTMVYNLTADVVDRLGAIPMAECGLERDLLCWNIPPLTYDGEEGLDIDVDMAATESRDYARLETVSRWLKSSQFERMGKFYALFKDPARQVKYMQCARGWLHRMSYREFDPVPVCPLMTYLYDVWNGDESKIWSCELPELTACTFVGFSKRCDLIQVSLSKDEDATQGPLVFQNWVGVPETDTAECYWIVPRDGKTDKQLTDEVVSRGFSFSDGSTEISSLAAYEYYAPVETPWRCYHIQWATHGRWRSASLGRILTDKIRDIISMVWYKWKNFGEETHVNIGSLRGRRSMDALFMAIATSVRDVHDPRIYLFAAFLNLIWGKKIIGFAEYEKSKKDWSIDEYMLSLVDHVPRDVAETYLKSAKVLTYSLERTFFLSSWMGNHALIELTNRDLVADATKGTDLVHIVNALDLETIFRDSLPIMSTNENIYRASDIKAALNAEFNYLKSGGFIRITANVPTAEEWASLSQEQRCEYLSGVYLDIAVLMNSEAAKRKLADANFVQPADVEDGL